MIVRPSFGEHVDVDVDVVDDFGTEVLGMENAAHGVVVKVCTSNTASSTAMVPLTTVMMRVTKKARRKVGAAVRRFCLRSSVSPKVYSVHSLSSLFVVRCCVLQVGCLANSSIGQSIF